MRLGFGTFDIVVFESVIFLVEGLVEFFGCRSWDVIVTINKDLFVGVMVAGVERLSFVYIFYIEGAGVALDFDILESAFESF